MSVKVTYSTKAFPIENPNQIGKIIKLTFPSLEEVKNKPLPEGYVFAFIPVEDGDHVYSDTIGWEFHKKE